MRDVGHAGEAEAAAHRRAFEHRHHGAAAAKAAHSSPNCAFSLGDRIRVGRELVRRAAAISWRCRAGAEGPPRRAAPSRARPRAAAAAASASRSASTHSHVGSALRTSGRFSVRCSTAPSRRWRTQVSFASLHRLGQRAFELADDAQHDLVGAAADRHQPAVAVGLRDRVVPGEAHAAPVLQAGVGHLARQAPGTLSLAMEASLVTSLPATYISTGAVGQGAALRPRCAVRRGGSAPPGCRGCSCRRPGAGACIRWSGRSGCPGCAGAGRAVQPLFLELQHLEHEAHALLADEVALGTRTLSKKSCAVSLRPCRSCDLLRA